MKTAVGAGTKTAPKPPTAALVRRQEDAIGKLQNQLDNARKLKKKVEDNAGEAGAAVVHMAESLAAAGAGSLAVGAAGRFKTHARVGRGLVASVLTGWGLLRVLGGKSGSHQLGVATGLVNGEVSEVAFAQGQKMQAKWADKNGQAAAPVAPVQGAPEIAVTPVGAAPQIREVLPADEALAAFRARGRARSMA